MAKQRKPLAHLKTVRARGKVYEYFDTGRRTIEGKRIYRRLPARSDVGFPHAYAACLAARTARQNVASVPTVAQVSRAYQQDQKFTRRSKGTQSTYLTYLARVEEEMGAAPITEVERRDVRAMLDKMADRPAAANMTLLVMRNLFAHAVKRELIAVSPTTGIEPYEKGEEYDPWPEDLIEAALADDAMRLPVALLYYTAQRIGDVCKMRWSDVRDGFLYVQQQKTGKELDIRVHDALGAILADTPRRSITILHGPKMRPMRPATLRGHLQRFADDRGVKIVPHGLRKNAINALLEAGCTVAEAAAISGQSLKMVEHYAKRRNNRSLGSAAILKWQGTEPARRKAVENS